MNPSYPELLHKIKTQGHEHVSQHGNTMEYLGATVLSMPGEIVRRTNINYNIGYMEALQLIAGVYNIHAMIEAAPNASHKLFTLPMAYGPRVAIQMPRLIEKLKEDPSTRQAIAFIGTPADGATNDQPCTTTIQFLLRQGVLYGFVGMRSWDLIKGLPYDFMMFHALVAVTAHCLGVQPGPVMVSAASAHIYERDMEREAVVDSGRSFAINPTLPTDWMLIREMAQEQVLNFSSWNKAEGMRHSIPPIFSEMYLAPDTRSLRLES